MNKFYRFLGFIVIVFCVQYIGSFAMDTSSQDWYDTLIKPDFTPADLVFGFVWTVLYIMMAAAATYLWCAKKSTARTKALTFWSLQLFFNFIWSYIFFRLRSPVIAFIDIGLIIILLILTLWYSYKVSKAAFFLLIPYFLWLIFAGALNLNIILLNN